MKHRTWVEISSHALEQNIDTLRGLTASEARFCAVVKGNAYGHGMEGVVGLCLKNRVDAFAVDNIDEALEVRKLAPEALVMTLGYVPSYRFDDAVRSGIHLVLSRPEEITQLEGVAAHLGMTASMHMKIDTGMSRLGLLPANLPDIFARLETAPHVEFAGVSMHFADIDNIDNPQYASVQYKRFRECLSVLREHGKLPPVIHAAKSAAIILYPDTHGTLVRAGISLYGIWPNPEFEHAARKHGIKCPLAPALEWKTRVALFKRIPAGTPVGYGLAETVTRDTRVAVLPVGYVDGYDRGFSSRASVLINGTRCKVLGRVCMNMTMIDVSSVPNVEVDQEATLLGRSGRHIVSARELAQLIGTNEYEIVARINPTIPRVML